MSNRAGVTARKQSLGQGNVFTPVCQYFCSQVEGRAMMSLPVMKSTPLDSTTLDSTPSTRHTTPWTAPSLDSTTPGQHPVWTAPPLDSTTSWTAPYLDSTTAGQLPSGQHHSPPFPAASGWYVSYWNSFLLIIIIIIIIYFHSTIYSL